MVYTHGLFLAQCSFRMTEQINCTGNEIAAGPGTPTIVIGVVIPLSFLAFVLLLVALHYVCQTLEARRIKLHAGRTKPTKHSRSTTLKHERQRATTNLPDALGVPVKSMPERNSIVTSTRRHLRQGIHSRNYQDLLRYAAESDMSLGLNTVSLSDRDRPTSFRFVYVSPPRLDATVAPYRSDPTPDYTTSLESLEDVFASPSIPHYNTPTEYEHHRPGSQSLTPPALGVSLLGSPASTHTRTGSLPGTCTSKSASDRLTTRSRSDAPTGRSTPSRPASAVHYVTSASTSEAGDKVK